PRLCDQKLDAPELQRDRAVLAADGIAKDLAVERQPSAFLTRFESQVDRLVERDHHPHGVAGAKPAAEGRQDAASTRHRDMDVMTPASRLRASASRSAVRSSP